MLYFEKAFKKLSIFFVFRISSTGWCIKYVTLEMKVLFYCSKVTDLEVFVIFKVKFPRSIK